MNHEKVLSDSYIRHINHCPDFAYTDNGDVETGKPYRPRGAYKPREQSEEPEQLTFEQEISI